jgi:hypothetical protein
MKEKLNKKIAIALLFVALMSVPIPNATAQQRAPGRQGLFIDDWCVFSSRMQAFTGMMAFGFGVMPGLQAVGVAYGAVTVGLKVIETVSCK